MVKKADTSMLGKLIYKLVVLIIVLVPFYSFISTWIGSNFGYLLFWRGLKEVILALAVILTLYKIYNNIRLRKILFKQNIILVIGLYTIWQLFVSALFSRDIDATALGLAIQLRGSLFFVVALVAGYYVPISITKLYKLVLVPATGVILFGLIQMFILPINFLSYFGYQKNITIPPFFTIDEQLDNLRIASTLRGPNPLGVYLIMPMTFIINHWAVVRRRMPDVGGQGSEVKNQMPDVISQSSNIKYQISNIVSQRSASVALGVLGLISLLIVLYGSHSRGAWIGASAAIVVYVFLSLPGKWKKLSLAGGFVLVVVMSLLVLQFRNTVLVQNVIFHDNPNTGGVVTSNEGHLDSLKTGINNVVERPLLGCGSGCVGPASVHNQRGVSFSENFFIQTAEESGIIGLIILLLLFGLVARLFYQKSDDPFARAMLASFVGICIASLTAHAWADDTIAYLWWGIAGLYLSRYIRLGSSTASAKHLHTSEKVSSRP